MTDDDEDGWIDYDYEDMCTDCGSHDMCHKNGIDYDKISKCSIEFNASCGITLKSLKQKEPKEKVEFT